MFIFKSYLLFSNLVLYAFEDKTVSVGIALHQMDRPLLI